MKPLVQSPSALPRVVTAEEVVLSWKGICWDNWESGGCCCSTSTLHRPGCGASPVVVKLIWEVPTRIFIYDGSKGGCAAKGALESSRPKPKLRRVSFKPRSSHWCFSASGTTEDNVCGTSLVGRYQFFFFLISTEKYRSWEEKGWGLQLFRFYFFIEAGRCTDLC